MSSVYNSYTDCKNQLSLTFQSLPAEGDAKVEEVVNRCFTRNSAITTSTPSSPPEASIA